MTAGQLRSLTTEVWTNGVVEFWLGDPREGGVRLEPKRVIKSVKQKDGRPTAPPRMQLVFAATDAPPVEKVAQSLPTDPEPDGVDAVPGISPEQDVLLVTT